MFTHYSTPQQCKINGFYSRKIKGRKQLFFKWVWKLVNSPNQNMFTLSHWSQTNIQLCQTCNYYRKAYIFTVTKFCVGLTLFSILFQNNDNFWSSVHNDKICGFRPWAWISLILFDCSWEKSRNNGMDRQDLEFIFFAKRVVSS